ncbi:hypothetical protein [Nocardia sp. NPDC058480]|uniref:hypothetical protein n=1 Tax=unclassified Nocardia TaxID=2637762 RepID=UPI0036500920
MKRAITTSAITLALFVSGQLAVAGTASADIDVPGPDAPFGSCAAYTCTDPLAYLLDLVTGSAG